MIQDKPPAISFHDLTLGYDRHPAVHHITGEVDRGDLLALVGPNGAGKSTLLKGVVGQLKPLSGSLSLDGLKRTDIAYLPQQIDIDRSFPITVFDAVAMGLWRQIGTWRGLDRGLNLAVLEALHTLGLQDLSKRSVGALSGGQFQRVLFARLLLRVLFARDMQPLLTPANNEAHELRYYNWYKMTDPVTVTGDRRLAAWQPRIPGRSASA